MLERHELSVTRGFFFFRYENMLRRVSYRTIKCQRSRTVITRLKIRMPSLRAHPASRRASVYIPFTCPSRYFAARYYFCVRHCIDIR